MENLNEPIQRLMFFLRETHTMLPPGPKAFFDDGDLQLKVFKHLLCVGYEAETVLMNNRYYSLMPMLAMLAQLKDINYINKTEEELKDLYEIIQLYFPLTLSNLKAMLAGVPFSIPYSSQQAF